MSTNPLGQGILGMVRPGDETQNGRIAHSKALGLSYVIASSEFGVALGLTYTVQAPNVAIMQLYYVISAPEGFAINGDSSIVWPDQVTYTPRPVTARSLLATPLIQGYATMNWSYTLLQQSEAQHLLSFYNPASPQVTLVFPDENGLWSQRQAAMLPPTYGAQETVSVEGFVLNFLLLHS